MVHGLETGLGRVQMFWSHVAKRSRIKTDLTRLWPSTPT